jgi:hypothetical protein
VTRRAVPVERNGETVRVDPRMADLLTAVWAHGIGTRSSRVFGGHSVVYMSFETPDDAVHFLNLVTTEEEPDVPDTWSWRAETENRAPDEGPPDHALRLRLKFPAESLPHVTATARAKPVSAT